MNRFAVLLTACALGACFSPTYNNPQCGPAGECPLGFTCELGVCHADDEPIDAPATDAPDPDAETDGMDPEIDAPPGTNCPVASLQSPTDPSRCFVLTSAASEWQGVRNECQGLGGDIADVLSNEENALLEITGGEPLWLGGTAPSNQNWVWIRTGDPFSYTSWAAGEPNGVIFTDLCLLSMGILWYDETCTDAYRGICVIPAT